MKTIQNTTEALNILLADYHMYYQKSRNFHWNITGVHFFELHTKFEELYESAKVKIDEIAERILTLKGSPMSNYSEYIDASSIKESRTNLTDREMVTTLISDHEKLLTQLEKTTKIAEENTDNGTLDILGAYIGELEKVNWMLNAWNQKS